MRSSPHHLCSLKRTIQITSLSTKSSPHNPTQMASSKKDITILPQICCQPVHRCHYDVVLEFLSSIDPGSLTSWTACVARLLSVRLLRLPWPSSMNGPASFRGVGGPSANGATERANGACEVGVMDRAPRGSLGVRFAEAGWAILIGLVPEELLVVTESDGPPCVSAGDGVPKEVSFSISARSSSVSSSLETLPS